MNTDRDAVRARRRSSRSNAKKQARPVAQAQRPRKRAIYSRDLGINLESRAEAEFFKWFLACLLFGKPIQQEIAERAYLTIVRAGLVSPEAVLAAGWDKLVQLLDEAHYVRYDFSTATKLLDVCRELKERYGTLDRLLAQARTPAELSARLQEFKHIGPVTARIFFREVRPIWYPSGKSAKQRRSASSRDA